MTENSPVPGTAPLPTTLPPTTLPPSEPPSEPSPSISTTTPLPISSLPVREPDDDGTVGPDQTGGLLAAGFLILLLGSEGTLTLPDAAAGGPAVAAFYSQHRVAVVALQLVGIAAAAFLAGYAWRLRATDRRVAAAGLLVAGLACLPSGLTALLGIVADPADPGRADTLNQLQPRADDLLFAGVALFALAVLLRLGRSSTGAWRPLAGIAGLTLLSCIVRYVLEIAGVAGTLRDQIAPICFLLLVGWMAVLSFRGTLDVGSAAVDA